MPSRHRLDASCRRRPAPSDAADFGRSRQHDGQDHAERQGQSARQSSPTPSCISATGPLEGLKLIGFSIWERRGGGGGRNVTFPARQYSVNGERRSFALLRPIVDTTAQNKIRELILEAFQEYEERRSVIAS